MKDIIYCSHIDCYFTDCARHQYNAPEGKGISIADLDDGYCFVPEQLIATKARHTRERLVSAICKGTQNTNYKCDNPAKAMCDVDGSCYYCELIAEAVLDEFKDCREGEAYWVDATKPGQITCGGNPVYTCGRCGDIYGSHELFPSAKYCRECGAKMKFNLGVSE